MNRQEYKDVIILFEKQTNPCCDDIEVKNMKVGKVIVTADIFVHEDCGEKTTIYRKCEYGREELENDTIFMRTK